MTAGTLLIVDGNKNDLAALRSVLRGEVEKIITIEDPGRISEVFDRNEIDIVLLEMNFRAGVNSGNEGLFWMREILSKDQDISVILLTAERDVESAVNAIREGAFDLILKPWEDAALLASVNAAWRLRQSRLEAKSLKSDNQLLKREINRGGERIIQGASPTMINVMNIVRKVAATGANVLITGEHGTGKEMVAREIHNQSGRSGELMVSVDMGSVTETLFESELFGHVRGAFTDAREDRKGKFEAAHGGTLFLDEIGNLPLQLQAKLLNVIQTRKVVRVGSNKQIPVDIRLICATNCSLPEMVREGRFREDLFYRINTIMIEVPPLRDRVDDIPVLAGHFLRINCEKYGKSGLRLSTQAMEKLSDYSWPGNVRELQHIIEKAVIMCEGNIIKPADLSLTEVRRQTALHEMTIEQMEKRLILESLKRYSNNMSVVADKLGITRQTLYNKRRKYSL